MCKCSCSVSTVLYARLPLHLLHEKVSEVCGLVKGGRVRQGGAPGQVLARSGRALSSTGGQLRDAEHVGSIHWLHRYVIFAAAVPVNRTAISPRRRYCYRSSTLLYSSTAHCTYTFYHIYLFTGQLYGQLSKENGIDR